MFLFKHTCKHARMSASVKFGYCPDCGEYVENKWYIAKCPICGKRYKTIIKNNQPVPEENFCSSCGSHDFIVEEIEYPDIVTINYAAYKTVKVPKKPKEVINAWIEERKGRISLLPMLPA